MKKITLILSILLLASSFIQAQKKKDLLIEIDQLKSKKDSVEILLNEARKNEKVSIANLDATKVQLEDLKKTNASLLSNLTSFTEASKKKSDNISKTLESLKEKERQLKVINEALTASDSTKLAVFSLFKNAVGDAAKISITNGVIVMAVPNTFLFGDNDTSFVIEEKAKGLLEKIGTTLNDNPTLKITVEGNSNAIVFKEKTLVDNWDGSTRQAAAIVRVLQNDYKVDPKRMDALGQGQYGSEELSIETATKIIIDPGFDAFYALIREHMKPSN